MCEIEMLIYRYCNDMMGALEHGGVMGQKFRKILVRGGVGAALVVLALAAASVSQAQLELNEHGVHARLLLPVAPQTHVAVHNYGGSGDSPVIPGFLDGPVVRRGQNGDWTATWFCEDHTEQRSGKGETLELKCAGKARSFGLAQVAVPASDVALMPARVVALSDIEGNLAYLDGALTKLGVVDGAGNWRFGSNHLVIVGDAVDRGRDVFAVLWRLHGLAQQAAVAGGALHMVIGNHEQYMLQGKMKSVHLEHAYGAAQMGGFRQAFAADTVLGAWLRQQPVVVRIGDVLFAHGGVSPALVAQRRTLAQLNDAMARYWRGAAAETAELEAVLGMDGLTQYRAMVGGGHGEAQASEAEVAQALQAFGVKRIVLGHTQVARVSARYGDKVYAINVNDNASAREVLVFEEGTAKVVDIGVARNLPEEVTGAGSGRPLRLTDAADRQAVWRLIESSYELSKLPRYF
jgi:hypothetical protein